MTYFIRPKTQCLIQYFKNQIVSSAQGVDGPTDRA